MRTGEGRLKYKQIKTDEWIRPDGRCFKLACCDCGLVHRLQFRLVKNGRRNEKKIQFRLERDERATGAMRRWMKKGNRDLLNTAGPVPTVVEFKAKSIGGIAVENIEAIPDMPGIVKKTYHEKK